MLDFAVHHDELPKDQGRWVFAIDHAKERFLLANTEDGSFYWKPISECRAFRIQSPDQPTLVIPVAPPQPQVVIPNGLQRPNGY